LFECLLLLLLLIISCCSGSSGVTFALSLLHLLLLVFVKIYTHIIGILPISIVLVLDLEDIEAKSVSVERNGGTVSDTDVEGAILGIIDGAHSELASTHKLGGDAKLTVGP
jgi:hypothetical protein